MPRLEEVQFYLKGILMLLVGRLEGFKFLDFSERGFWRSWWAVVYCLPPMMLNWGAMRVYYLSTMPEGARAGLGMIFRLATLDIAVWIASYLALGAVMSGTGYAARLLPAIIAINWLAVPIQWSMIPLSLILIFSPDNSDLYVSTWLPLIILWAVSHYLVIRRLVDGKGLPASAFLLTLLVSGLWTSINVGNLLDLSV